MPARRRCRLHVDGVVSFVLRGDAYVVGSVDVHFGSVDDDHGRGQDHAADVNHGHDDHGRGHDHTATDVRRHRDHRCAGVADLT